MSVSPRPAALLSELLNPGKHGEKSDSIDPAKVYDRSSLEGDFLITIPDQTAEEFEKYAPESLFCEFFDGTIYMPAPVSSVHQDVVGFLFDLLNGYRFQGGAGRARMGPAVLRIDAKSKPEPDIFVCPAGDDSGTQAVLVIEVISRGHEDYDLKFKDAFYREMGIPETWYADPNRRQLMVRRKGKDSYRTEEYSSGAVHANGIPGFWIDVDWLWADPEVNPRDCLASVLAAPPAQGAAPDIRE